MDCSNLPDRDFDQFYSECVWYYHHVIKIPRIIASAGFSLFPDNSFYRFSIYFLFVLSFLTHTEYSHNSRSGMASDHSSDIVDQNVVHAHFARTRSATYSASSTQSPCVIKIRSFSQPFACSAAISTILFKDFCVLSLSRSPAVFPRCPYE